jgi:hypothetical protein
MIFTLALDIRNYGSQIIVGFVENEQSSVTEKVVACKKASKATKPQRV